jgi:hypothetical protein
MAMLPIRKFKKRNNDYCSLRKKVSKKIYKIYKIYNRAEEPKQNEHLNIMILFPNQHGLEA